MVINRDNERLKEVLKSQHDFLKLEFDMVENRNSNHIRTLQDFKSSYKESTKRMKFNDDMIKFLIAELQKNNNSTGS